MKEFDALLTKEQAIEFIEGKYDEYTLNYLQGETLPGQNSSNAEHVLHCLKAIIAQLFGIHPCEDFGRAILKNDFMEVVGCADSINVISLNLYVKFLYNKVSAKLLREARKKKG